MALLGHSPVPGPARSSIVSLGLSASARLLAPGHAGLFAESSCDPFTANWRTSVRIVSDPKLSACTFPLRIPGFEALREEPRRDAATIEPPTPSS